MRLALVLCISLSSACWYKPTFSDCKVACLDSTDCPNGFSCGGEGLCRTGERVTATCAELDLRDAADPNADAPGSDGVGDAGVMQTLVQTTSTQNADGNSLSCLPGLNSWYRVFPLADFGITGGFSVTKVTIGVQDARGSPNVQIKIGRYTSSAGAATLDLAQIIPINSVNKTFAATTSPGNNVVVPVTGFIASGNLIVEVLMQNNTSSTAFFIGASDSGEIAPGYWRAPDCSVPTPQVTGAIRPNVNLNITVTGVR